MFTTETDLVSEYFRPKLELERVDDSIPVRRRVGEYDRFYQQIQVPGIALVGSRTAVNPCRQHGQRVEALASGCRDMAAVDG